MSHYEDASGELVAACSRGDLRASDFAFTIPQDLISQQPPVERGNARLLVLDRNTGHMEHCYVSDVPRFLAGKTVYVNNSALNRSWIELRPARGMEIHACLLRPLDSNRWVAFLRSRPKAIRGPLTLEDGTAVRVDEALEDNRYILSFERGPDVERLGRYFLAPDWSLHPHIPEGRIYQSIYARKEGSFFAPTAGIHLTQDILAQLRIRELTLHIRAGFYEMPLGEELPQEDSGEPEAYEIPEPPEGPAVAIGTTVVKALETWARTGEKDGASSLFIRPPFEFRVVEALLTLLHRPRQTLQLMVAAFAGHDAMMKVYREAVERRYRFRYSDDLLLIL